MSKLLLRRSISALAGLSFVGLAACKGNKTGYEHVVDYTTPKTGLSQEEYPFDSEGNYLEDVVAGRKKGKPGKPVAEEPKPTYVDLYEKPSVTPVLATASPPVTTPVSYDFDRPPERTTSSSSSSGSTASKPKPKPPVAKPKPKPVAKPKPKPKPKPTSIAYTVKRGDTLYSLANRYGTSVSAIKSMNGLRSDLLKDGRSLRIPTK